VLPPGIGRASSRWWQFGTAALAAGAGILVFVRSRPDEQTVVPVSSQRVYETTSGQRTTIRLADGSMVVLAPDTRLAYAVDASGARTATLDGEAFFTVAPRANRPFSVKTGLVTTRVLGTAFDVRRYRADVTTQVTVVSGRVSVGGHLNPVVLAAGAMARATDSTVTVSALADPAATVSWTQGRLVFDNAPVSVMLQTLSRWYGYEFRLDDTTLASRHVSIVFATDQTAETMNTVKTLLRVTMTFDGNVVTLHPDASARSKTRRMHRDLSHTTEREVGR